MMPEYTDRNPESSVDMPKTDELLASGNSTTQVHAPLVDAAVNSKTDETPVREM